VFLQNNVIDGLQQRGLQTKGSEKILVLNKENRTIIEELQVKYETSKKDQQIKLDEITIKNKGLYLLYSLAGASVIFVALLIIIFLYKKRNKAYRHLVYLNLNIVGKNQHEADEEDDMPDYHNTIDNVLKQQITACLNKQINSKIYLEPGLSIKYLSEKCETNRSYLSQIIHEKYGMNFNTFINKYRIDEAKRIFIDPDNDIPLKALYEQLGFSSYPRFNETFKKYTGVTPSFFLKTIKKL